SVLCLAPAHAMEESVAMSLVLIGGGSRSGKSKHAIHLARETGSRLAFLATDQAGDAEMRARIQLHQQERGDGFAALEEPIAVADRIVAATQNFDAIVIDCATLWLSNLLFAGIDIESESVRLIETAAGATARIFLVTNEVGCGIVPENALAREFRDHA